MGPRHMLPHGFLSVHPGKDSFLLGIWKGHVNEEGFEQSIEEWLELKGVKMECSWG